jgi:hypothetical protein
VTDRIKRDQAVILRLAKGQRTIEVKFANNRWQAIVHGSAAKNPTISYKTLKGMENLGWVVFCADGYARITELGTQILEADEALSPTGSAEIRLSKL